MQTLPPSIAREVFANLCASLPPPRADTPEARAARDEVAMAAVAALHPTDALEAMLAADIVLAEACYTDSLRQAGECRSDFAATSRCRAQAMGMLRQMRGLLREYEGRQAKRDKALEAMHPAAMERAGYWFAMSRCRCPSPHRLPRRQRRLSLPRRPLPARPHTISPPSPRPSSTRCCIRSAPAASAPGVACRRAAISARPNPTSSRTWSTAPARSCARSITPRSKRLRRDVRFLAGRGSGLQRTARRQVIGHGVAPSAHGVSRSGFVSAGGKNDPSATPTPSCRQRACPERRPGPASTPSRGWRAFARHDDGRRPDSRDFPLLVLLARLSVKLRVR
jgi:hypothetical protein